MTSIPCKRCFVMSRGFLVNDKNFGLVRKCIFKLFVYGNHPSDSFITKVIDRIMGLCIELTWCKYHDNILYGQCDNASIISFLYDDHPNGTP